jgi:hypothetical protein
MMFMLEMGSREGGREGGRDERREPVVWRAIPDHVE